MAEGLEPGDHYILRKLAKELLPWMIGGRLISRQWFVYGAAIYAYGGELATALTGIGIGAPVIAVFQGTAVKGTSGIDVLHEALQGAGQPIFVEDHDHRRYEVILEIENAPSDAFAATFELDPSSSYDAVHTLTPEPDGGFRLATSISGDYPVVVRVLRKGGEDLILKDGLARGLRRMYDRTSALAVSPVDEALSYIADH